MRLTTAYVFTVLVTCPGTAVAQFEASALEVSGGVFQREYENATVRLDCHSFNATIRPKI